MVLSNIFSLFMKTLFLNIINYFYIFRPEDIFVLFLMRNILAFFAGEIIPLTGYSSVSLFYTVRNTGCNGLKTPHKTVEQRSVTSF